MRSQLLGANQIPHARNADGKKQTLDDLEALAFKIEYLSPARAILNEDFPEALIELAAGLSGATIPIEEIIAGGGGEAKVHGAYAVH